MGLFTLHNYCAASSLDYLKSYLEFKSRLSIPEFSGYHCIIVSSLIFENKISVFNRKPYFRSNILELKGPFTCLGFFMVN